MSVLWFILALGGALCNAIFNYSIKKIMKDIDPLFLLAWTYLLGGITMSFFVLPRGIPVIGPSFFPTLGIIVAMGMISLSFYFYAIKMSDLSLCIPILSFTPVFLLFTSSVLLGESSTPYGIAGICCIVLGAYLISFSRENGILMPFHEFFRQRGVALMFVVAFLFAVGVNFDKMLVLQSDPLFGAMASFLALGCAFFLLSCIRFKTIRLIKKQNVFPFLFAGAILAAEALTINYAYTLAIVPYVISVKRMSILFSVLLGGVLFNEPDLRRRLIASGVMVLGVVIIGFS